MTRSRFALLAGLAAESVVVIGLLVSIARPNHRFWPPGERSWAFGLYWICGAVLAASGAVVGYLDQGSWRIDRWWIRPVGGVVATLGLAMSVRSGLELRLGESMGLEGRLYTDGLYQYTRNPQYVGNLVAICGFTAIANSARFALLALGSGVWHLLLPFAEEPWLDERYGEEYAEYRKRVPRFIGRRTLTRLIRRSG